MRCLSVAFIWTLALIGFGNATCYGNLSTCQTSTTEDTNGGYCSPSTVFQPTTIRRTTTIEHTKTCWSTAWSTLTALVTTTLTTVSTVVSASVSSTSIERVTTITETTNATVEVTRESTSTVTSVVTSTLVSVDLQNTTLETTRTTSIILDPTATITEPSASTETAIRESTQTLTIEATRTEERVSTATEISVTISTDVIEVDLTTTELLPTTLTQITPVTSVTTTERTVFIVSTILQISAVSVEVTRTLTSPTLITTTSYITVTETPSTPPTSPTRQLIGLVTCTTRDINPSYTPSAPLPANYTWGCPPGKVCQPLQDNCNFEEDFPSPTYICSPNECIDAPPLPPPDTSRTNYSCGALYDPLSGYFHLSPVPFGLDYTIFNINDQQPHPCPDPAPPTSWHDWQPHEGTFATRPTRRQTGQEQAPGLCYKSCDYVGMVGQSVGLVRRLCENSEFEGALDDCNDCIAYYKGDVTPNAVPPLLVQLHPFVNYCRSLEMEASTAATLAPEGMTVIGSVGPTSGFGSGDGLSNGTGAAGVGVFAVLGTGEVEEQRRTTVSLDVAATMSSSAGGSAGATSEPGGQGQMGSRDQSGDHGSGETVGSLLDLQPTELRSGEQAAVRNGVEVGSYAGSGRRERPGMNMVRILVCLVLCFSAL